MKIYAIYKQSSLDTDDVLILGTRHTLDEAIKVAQQSGDAVVFSYDVINDEVRNEHREWPKVNAR